MHFSKLSYLPNILLLLIAVASAQGQIKVSMEEANKECKEDMKNDRAIAKTRAPDGSAIICAVAQCIGSRDAYVDPADQELKCCPRDTKWQFDEEAKIGSCCAEGQKLSINAEAKEGACCGEGHSFFWDSTAKKGICCPSDSEGFKDGECVPKSQPPSPPTNQPPPPITKPGDCTNKPQTAFPCDDCHAQKVCPNRISMGMQFGRCYQFADEKRGTLGRYMNEYQLGGIIQGLHFKLCKSTTDCGVGEELKPGQPFYLQDMLGEINDRAGRPAWMNAAANGGHKTVTNDANGAGKLSAKPACLADGCMLCLHGTDNFQGFGMSCPSPQSGISQFQNPNLCLPLKVTQVRCNDDESEHGEWIFNGKGVSILDRQPQIIG